MWFNHILQARATKIFIIINGFWKGLYCGTKGSQCFVSCRRAVAAAMGCRAAAMASVVWWTAKTASSQFTAMSRWPSSINGPKWKTKVHLINCWYLVCSSRKAYLASHRDHKLPSMGLKSYSPRLIFSLTLSSALFWSKKLGNWGNR